MIKPTIEDTTLHLVVQGMDKLWSFKSQLTIPLEHITSIRVDREIVKKVLHGFKMPGTAIPYVITAGTYFQDGKRVFWDIHHPKAAVVICLHDEKYNELVIEVENPEIFVKEVQSRITTGKGN